MKMNDFSSRIKTSQWLMYIGFRSIMSKDDIKKVNLTVCVIVYYCLPAFGVFSKLICCICIYGFNFAFRSLV